MDSTTTTTDAHAVTKFVDPNPPSTVTAEFEKPALPSSDHASIADFLARPVFQYNAYWETTDELSHDITDPLGTGIGLPSDAILRSNAMLIDKLKGYNLISATIHYRIQANCNAFQQGRLLAHFLPFHTTAGDDYVKMHNFNMTTKTQQFGVELDCRMPTVELSVPFLAPATHYELNTGTNPLWERGRLHVSVLSPLKTGATGTQDVEVAVWSWFTDVELRAPIVPQSSMGTSRKRGKFRGKKFDAAGKEKDVMMETKVISKGLAAGGKLASVLSAIPSMTTIAAPAAWVMNTLSGVAASFGYSKPDVELVPAPFTSVIDKYAATSDGANPAIPLACMSNNALSRGNYSYGDDDEMSMAYLLSREAYIDTFEMTTTSVHNSVLYTLALAPNRMVTSTPQTVGTNTQSILTGPPLAYLSNKFLFWKGGIKIRFSIVKTEMQSGKIQLTYTPRVTNTVTHPTVSTGSYPIRYIIDIASHDGDTEYCFPYMSASPGLTQDQSMGELQVRVINSLRSPEAAASSIDVLVYASACDDFEFSVPCNAGQNVMPIVPQMDDSLDGPFPATTDFGETCVGERIMSIRQILRFTQLYHTESGTKEWWPFGFGYSTQTSDPAAPLTTPVMTNDLYSFLGHMYALYRGSVDVLASTTLHSKNNQFGYLNFRVADGDDYVQDPLTGDGLGINQTNLAGTGINPIVASDTISVLAVPYYNRFPVSLVIPSLVVPDEPSRPLTSVVTNASGYGTFYARRIREDFQFSLFVGCPPYIVINED
eukprot:387961_1